MMAVGFAAMVAAVPQSTAASRSAYLFPASICLTMSRPMPPFTCDNVASLSVCLLSGEDCSAYGLQTSVLTGSEEKIYGCHTRIGYNGMYELYDLRVSPALNFAQKLA